MTWQYHHSASCGNKVQPGRPVASEDSVSHLASMGFNYVHCQKAATNTSNTGVEEGMSWLLSHMDDPGWCANAKKLHCLLLFFYLETIISM
jgi:hypothetical protein